MATKYYKLLKDLPTLKKGALFSMSDSGNLFLENPIPLHYENKVTAYHHTTLEKYPNILGEWFGEVVKPKEYWFVDDRQGLYKSYDNDEWIDTERKEIGNYFETKEEAQLAIRQLKAWKRLKDKGFRFVDFDWKNGTIRFEESPIKDGEGRDKFFDDLDLLFGGEE